MVMVVSYAKVPKITVIIGGRFGLGIMEYVDMSYNVDDHQTRDEKTWTRIYHLEFYCQHLD
jgi:hypothetical protein